MNPLSGALPALSVPARVTLGAEVAPRYTYAPRSSLQNLAVLLDFSSPVIIFVEGFHDPIFDGVGLAGFKTKANTFLLA